MSTMKLARNNRLSKQSNKKIDSQLPSVEEMETRMELGSPSFSSNSSSLSLPAAEEEECNSKQQRSESTFNLNSIDIDEKIQSQQNQFGENLMEMYADAMNGIVETTRRWKLLESESKNQPRFSDWSVMDTNEPQWSQTNKISKKKSTSEASKFRNEKKKFRMKRMSEEHFIEDSKLAEEKSDEPMKSRVDQSIIKFKKIVKNILLWIKIYRHHSSQVKELLKLFAPTDLIREIDPESEKKSLLPNIASYKANRQPKMAKNGMSVIKKLPQDRTEMEIKLLTASIINYEAIKDLPKGMQMEIARRCWLQKLEAYSVIIREGDHPLYFYLIMSGSVLVSVIDREKLQAMIVAKLDRGDMFGELSIIYKTKRMSSVIAREPTQLLVISKEDYMELFCHGGEKAETNRFLSHCACFYKFPVGILEDRPEIMKATFFSAGTVMVEDSHMSDYIFVIKSGKAKVVMMVSKARLYETIKLDGSGGNLTSREYASRVGTDSDFEPELDQSLEKLPPFFPAHNFAELFIHSSRTHRRSLPRKRILTNSTPEEHCQIIRRNMRKHLRGLTDGRNSLPQLPVINNLKRSSIFENNNEKQRSESQSPSSSTVQKRKNMISTVFEQDETRLSPPSNSAMSSSSPDENTVLQSKKLATGQNFNHPILGIPVIPGGNKQLLMSIGREDTVIIGKMPRFLTKSHFSLTPALSKKNQKNVLPGEHVKQNSSLITHSSKIELNSIQMRTKPDQNVKIIAQSTKKESKFSNVNKKSDDDEKTTTKNTKNHKVNDKSVPIESAKKKAVVGSTSDTTVVHGKRTVATDLNRDYYEVQQLIPYEELEEVKDPKEYITIQVLSSGMHFGLIDIVYQNQPSVKLISDGCEAFVVKKAAYLAEVLDETIYYMGHQMRPYPTVEDVIDRTLQCRKWQNYRSHLYNKIAAEKIQTARSHRNPRLPTL